jgi:hypothetical protein
LKVFAQAFFKRLAAGGTRLPPRLPDKSKFEHKNLSKANLLYTNRRKTAIMNCKERFFRKDKEK